VFDEEINLLEYWLVIKRRSRAILGLAFLMALIGLLIAFTITPQYTSTVKILVEPDAPKVVSLDPLQGASNIWYFYETQYEIIASRSVAEAVVENLKLEQHPYFIKAMSELKEESSGSASGTWKSLISDSEPKVKNIKNEIFLVREAIIQTVLGGISVKGAKKSQIINISYESPDPGLSALIANAIVQAYIEKGLDAKLALNQNAAEWLNNRLLGLRQKLEISETALRNFQQKEGMVGTESFASITSGKLGGITEALIKSQSRRAEAEIRYQQVKDIKISGKALESLPIVLQNTFIQTLKAGQAKLARKVSELSERYGYKHPKMIAAKADLSIANR
ncbi:MAG: GumC family protein, partial [Gammaproteobacteria bacterium]|nr:GumC family protein [Gammaproteobacteria bacterium]